MENKSCNICLVYSKKIHSPEMIVNQNGKPMESSKSISIKEKNEESAVPLANQMVSIREPCAPGVKIYLNGRKGL